MVVEDSSGVSIDIHSGKLSEWLQSRRHCVKEWREKALKIREKIAHAIQDMPEHPAITEMLSGTYITYFHCVKIVDVLRETEAGSKNIFGRYSSQRMKDWQEIVQMYEKDNIYLAEAAQILQQFVQYEIPALKRQIAKCQSNEQECEKKEVDYEKLSRESERLYRQECQKMSIEGQNLKHELLRLSETLPQRFDRFVENAKQLKPLVNYYDEFRRITAGSNANKVISLPLLRMLQEKGNVTVFEWRNGFPPSSIERFLGSSMDENEDAAEQEAAIDFGFDDGVVVSEDAVNEIDFGIEEVVSSESPETASVDTVARLDDALTVLEYRECLSQVVTDLKELDAFLLIRSIELHRQQASDALIMGSGATFNVVENVEDIRKYRDQVGKLLSELNDAGLKNLRKLRISPAYVEKLADTLSEPLKRSRKYAQMRVLMKEQQTEHRKTIQDTQKQCELLTKRAKELQKQIEQDISKRYQNRPVNIIGIAAATLN